MLQCHLENESEELMISGEDENTPSEACNPPITESCDPEPALAIHTNQSSPPLDEQSLHVYIKMPSVINDTFSTHLRYFQNTEHNICMDSLCFEEDLFSNPLQEVGSEGFSKWTRKQLFELWHDDFQVEYSELVTGKPPPEYTHIPLFPLPLIQNDSHSSSDSEYFDAHEYPNQSSSDSDESINEVESASQTDSQDIEAEYHECEVAEEHIEPYLQVMGTDESNGNLHNNEEPEQAVECVDTGQENPTITSHPHEPVYTHPAPLCILTESDVMEEERVSLGLGVAMFHGCTSPSWLQLETSNFFNVVPIQECPSMVSTLFHMLIVIFHIGEKPI